MRPRIEITAQAIVDALKACNGDLEAVGERLGVSSRTVRRRIAEFGIKADVRYVVAEEAA